MFKLAVTLARQCRAENHELLAKPLVRVLDDIEELVPVRAVRDVPMIARDPQAGQLQILFIAAPPRAREAVLSIARLSARWPAATRGTIRSDPAHDCPPGGSAWYRATGCTAADTSAPQGPPLTGETIRAVAAAASGYQFERSRSASGT